MSTAVAIFISKELKCTGTILSSDMIITAAHCFDYLENIETDVDIVQIVAEEGDLMLHF